MSDPKVLRVRTRGPSHTHEGPNAAQDHAHARPPAKTSGQGASSGESARAPLSQGELEGIRRPSRPPQWPAGHAAPSNSSTPSPAGEAAGRGRHAGEGAGGEGASVAVSARDRAAVGPELQAFVSALGSADAKRQYSALLDALDRGTVDGEHVGRLESFLELVLTTGRVRQRQGLHAESAFRRLFAKTPRGAALEASAGEVTKALASLKGQTIEEIAVSLVRPGTYRLVLETGQHRVSIGLAPAGAHVESLEVTL